MKVTIQNIADYLVTYITSYRENYNLFTKPSPNGGGYPKLNISPYLNSNNIYCYIARDGIAIADYSLHPMFNWQIAGGPAIVSDFPDPHSRIPEWVKQTIEKNGLTGKFIGIYRVTKAGIPDEVWQGDLNTFQTNIKRQISSTTLHLFQYDYSWVELIQRLTFGVFSFILDLHLPDDLSPFWSPYIIRYFGFLPADRTSSRFFSYLELSPHLNLAAWDLRTIPVRTHTDVRRDFGFAFATNETTLTGGTISFGNSQPFHDRLSLLQNAIINFKTLLDREGHKEQAIQDFLENHPILLSVYGNAIPRPRFVYPPDETPIGKSYVEPDFIFQLPGQSYILFELERASKKIATQQGQPRSEVNQAAFQIAEWRTYIQKHYYLIKEQFPGIAIRHQFKIIISRDNNEAFGERRDIIAYKELLKNLYNVDDVLTYDDLLAQANEAYFRLTSII